MALRKKLETGVCVETHNYDEGIYCGQTAMIKDSNAIYQPVVHIESVHCETGLVNRIVIKKSELEKMGFVIIEE